MQEHGIGPDGFFVSEEAEIKMEGVNTSILFSEDSIGRWRPRSLFFDNDADQINGLLADRVVGDLIQPEQYCYGDTVSTYDYRLFKVDRNLLDCSCELIRRETESMDSVGDFIFYSAQGGGTGSGLSRELKERLNVSYGAKFQAIGMTVVPPPDRQLGGADAIASYNNLLGLNKYGDSDSLSIWFDNAQLYRMHQKLYGASSTS